MAKTTKLAYLFKEYQGQKLYSHCMSWMAEKIKQQTNKQKHKEAKNQYSNIKKNNKSILNVLLEFQKSKLT
ncbi:hypothetical protein TTHERM_00127010 (macronuclear) [Tetrahymena thermophila SB210]|uniref:Uncharacterized protein n=1 Tax=Tetrahymena thermophila (strain SB210) TaxID=312017 RepID=I7M1C0_TETTS|nr:hypothetical protein TTHERM_00127010 [Tetrahymena thermophila SB210]EAR96036.1 hypothetical protein TTHERM_00127010 [Tetrahymena thermophila SB210]|eukprot:XP_001016281.1 hypothetical protein TTHERM_00127010 [Tetrahymena thermophila SB210]